MKTTRYHLTTHQKGVSFKAAVVADLHDRPFHEILPILEAERPDLILIPGDLTERLDRPSTEVSREGLSLLGACAAIAPTFYSLGNHEIGGCHGRIYKAKLRGDGNLPPFVLLEEWRQIIEKSGVTFLDNTYVEWNGLVIGGLGSGLLDPHGKPDLSWLDAFSAAEGYKLLLCHHPEYFDRYLRPFHIDLTVSGHAHGGQWRILGQGIYAPDQFLFPKYTSGVHEDRLVISRGVCNTFPMIPRFFNPREVVFVTVGGEGS